MPKPDTTVPAVTTALNETHNYELKLILCNESGDEVASMTEWVSDLPKEALAKYRELQKKMLEIAEK